MQQDLANVCSSPLYASAMKNEVLGTKNTCSSRKGAEISEKIATHSVWPMFTEANESSSEIQNSDTERMKKKN